jgi:hypothetical protein
MKSTKAAPKTATKSAAKASPKDKPLAMIDAAKVLGVPEAFLLTLTLTGAREPSDNGGNLVEIDYSMDGNDPVFSRESIDRFRKRCPVDQLIDSPAVGKRLGINRAQVAGLVFTGIATEDGRVLRLPVWVIGGREYVTRNDLEGYAEHYKAAMERKATREFQKRYKRTGTK